VPEQYDNSGVLFVNDRKEKETQPDYTGNIVMGGVKKRLAGWKKTSKSDPSMTFLSISVSDFQEQKEEPVQQKSDQDGLPF
tara:strand:+ start:821 stop:1063 length:243 start_codon:yes stop_codon:yes gene_type:complete